MILNGPDLNQQHLRIHTLMKSLSDVMEIKHMNQTGDTLSPAPAAKNLC